MFVVFFMLRPPPRSSRTNTPFPYRTLFLSIRAATSVCEAIIGRRLFVRAAEDVGMLRAGVAMLSVRPVVGVDAVTLLTADGGEAVLGEGDYRLTIEIGRAHV